MCTSPSPFLWWIRPLMPFAILECLKKFMPKHSALGKWLMNSLARSFFSAVLLFKCICYDLCRFHVDLTSVHF